MKTLRMAGACAAAVWMQGAAAQAPWEVPLLAAPADSADVPWLAQADARPEVRVFANPGGRTLAFIADELGQERVVKGAPYCADAVHESIQPLADGNRIVHKQLTRLCRDGEGRTRQEVHLDGRKRVYLRDPVARESWLLDPERKTARRLVGGAGRMDLATAADSAAWRDYADRMREWARGLSERMRSQPPGAGMPAPPMPATPAVPAVPPTMPSPPGGAVSWSAARPVVIVAGDPAQQLAGGERHVDVQVLRPPGRDGEWAHALPQPPDAPAALPPPLAHRLPGLAPRGPGVSSPLGSQSIEGLRVDGERTTWTIEAGRLGNEKPIVITREVWTSPELLLTVQSREVDPRHGETHYRLSNVRRGEPDAALMKPPADYDTRRGDQRPPAAAPGASGRG